MYKDLETKTFVFYPEFSGMKDRIANIIILGVIGVLLISMPEMFGFSKMLGNIFLELLGGIFLLFSLAIFVISSLYINNVKYILTTKRLTIELGSVTKKISNLELCKIIDMEITQNTIQLIFGGCTLTLNTDDLSDPRIDIIGLNIEHARQVYELIRYFVDQSVKDKIILKAHEIDNQNL